jgi:hypothetical protein
MNCNNKWVRSLPAASRVPVELRETMCKTIENWDNASICTNHCKRGLYNWLCQDDYMKGQVAANLDAAQMGIVPFSRRNDGSFAGIIFAPKRGGYDVFFGTDVKQNTEFRILINCDSGEILQLYHKIDDECLACEISTGEANMPWDLITTVWSDRPFF